MEITMKDKICPWYLGWFLASPVRTLLYNPQKLLRPYLREGMTALDIGSGMGFFTLPMAELVGKQGRVVAVDVQPQMLDGLRKRAEKKQIVSRIQTQLCGRSSLNLDTLSRSVDLALLFAVVHELPDPGQAFAEVYQTIKPGGLVIFSEPDKHVSRQDFEQSVAMALAAGFMVKEWVTVRATHCVVLMV